MSESNTSGIKFRRSRIWVSGISKDRKGNKQKGLYVYK